MVTEAVLVDHQDTVAGPTASPPWLDRVQFGGTLPSQRTSRAGPLPSRRRMARDELAVIAYWEPKLNAAIFGALLVADRADRASDDVLIAPLPDIEALP